MYQNTFEENAYMNFSTFCQILQFVTIVKINIISNLYRYTCAYNLNNDKKPIFSFFFFEFIYISRRKPCRLQMERATANVEHKSNAELNYPPETICISKNRFAINARVMRPERK